MKLATNEAPMYVPAQRDGRQDDRPVTTDRPRTVVAGYGLMLPTVEQVHESLERSCPHDCEPVWNQLLLEVGIDGTEEDRDSLERLLAAMASSVHHVAAVTARAQAIRLSSFDRLSALHPCAEVAPTHETLTPGRSISRDADAT